MRRQAAKGYQETRPVTAGTELTHTAASKRLKRARQAKLTLLNPTTLPSNTLAAAIMVLTSSWATMTGKALPRSARLSGVPRPRVIDCPFRPVVMSEWQQQQVTTATGEFVSRTELEVL